MILSPPSIDTPTRRLAAGLRLLAVICCVCSVCVGCDNLFFDAKDVRLQPVSNEDTGDAQLADAEGDVDARDVVEDAPDTGDHDSGDHDSGDTDSGDTDSGDTSDATDVESDTGDASDVTDSGGDAGYPFGHCSPITESCLADEYCKLRFEPGTPPRLFTVCDDTTNAGSSQVGQSCASANDCAPQSYCVNWNNPDPRGQQCSRYCVLATGEGCAGDEFCTNPFDILDGLGFCTKSCDPLAPNCAQDTQCHPHPGYSSGQALEPHFQCLAVDDDFSASGEGSDCDVDNVNLDGCAAGLVCYPTGAGDKCVTPCSNDGDCTSTCAAPAGDWSLRFCSL